MRNLIHGSEDSLAEDQPSTEHNWFAAPKNEKRVIIIADKGLFGGLRPLNHSISRGALKGVYTEIHNKLFGQCLYLAEPIRQSKTEAHRKAEQKITIHVTLKAGSGKKCHDNDTSEPWGGRG